MRLGAHVSIGGGYAQAARRAIAAGCDVYQYFPKNPRGLSVKVPAASDMAACAAICRDNGIASVAHTAYPVNLAYDPDDVRREAVVRTLVNDLYIAEGCGSMGVVVHFGVYSGADPLTGYRNIVLSLDETLRRYEGPARLLIENQAGDRSDFGMTIEEMVRIRELCAGRDRIGFCLDTCHAFASGLWSNDEPGFARLAEHGDQLGYWPLVGVIHLNDSRYPCGSRKDRHANVGSGHIGWERMLELLAFAGRRSIPLVLETPGSADRRTAGHAGEIAEIRRRTEDMR
ncbi:deoxyribonuclease IV [Paenibacillus thermoaerophilus]|nr:deoxyribonuclease IV [Paenibacillus thermoaerophilus]TMV17137.1 deoxyribonuclease IV [Paenibacillus thermoaerophilus]